MDDNGDFCSFLHSLDTQMGRKKKIKAFFYVHSVTDADRENILSLEKSYFKLRQNSAKKQTTMYDFFCLKKVVSGLTVSPYSSFVFSTPLKNDRSRFHCISTCNSRILFLVAQKLIPKSHVLFLTTP
jgi:hypothetical protein